MKKHIIEIRVPLAGNDSEWLTWEGDSIPPAKILNIIKKVDLEDIFITSPHPPEDLSCEICNTVYRVKK